MSNVDLRKAIAHAIDRQAIVDNIYQGLGQVAKNPIPPTMWGYNDNVPGFKDCLQKSLQKLDFPKFKNLRQSGTYTITVEDLVPPSAYMTQPGETGSQSYDPDSFGGYQPPPDSDDLQPTQPQQTPPSGDLDAF